MFAVLFCLGLYSCSGDKKSNCIESMMDDGYSYDEAKEACDDAERDSQAR